MGGVLSADVQVLLLSGSTRAGSTNTAVLRTAQVLAPEGVSAHLYAGLADLPGFVPGDDAALARPEVTTMLTEIRAADAVLICTPEYAGALPGSFKNLLDWTVGGGELYGKPLAWINAANQGRGGGAMAELETVLGYVGARILPTACARLSLAREQVGPDGVVTDPGVRDRIVAVWSALSTELAQLR